MTHSSLFSGIGGFELAAEWMGWENLFHCELNPFGQKVLKHHFPNSISYNDITKTDFSIHRGQVDILTGGFPCQPYSSAGKRLGTEDERHLWPEMLRTIQEVQPRWIVGENVFGLVNWNGGLVFEEVQTDLEAKGYEVQAYVLPAAGVNAPHQRYRVWFVAYSKLHEVNYTNTRTSSNKKRDVRRGEEGNVFNSFYSNGIDSNTTSNGLEHGTETRQVPREKTNAKGERNKSSISVKANGYGYKPNWHDFPTQSPICGGDDGIPKELDSITFSKWRNESIKAYGNAIVPQVAHQLFKAIEEFELMVNK